jgi:PAS domain S-box-containing protein
MKRRLIFLWAIVGLFTIATGIGLNWFSHQIQHEEFERSQRESQVANDAFVEHARQVVGQADNLLRAVRSHYLHTRSIELTERFIASLGLEKSLYGNIYLIDANGKVLITHDAEAKEHNMADREYFHFHRATPDDRIYIAPTAKGRITKQHNFRITRRINLPDGAFGGVMVITIRPDALTNYFKRISTSPDTIATLVGINDRKIRARYPEPPPSIFDHPIESPLWDALAQAPSGSYRGPSAIDGTVRQFVYKQVGDHPLVMVHGFSETDVQAKVNQRMRLIIVVALSVCALVVMMALILTLVIRNRELQQRYLAELQESNDRNMALFNSTHEAVILLDGERSIDCNPEALRMFGAPSKAESLGHPPWSPHIAPPRQPDGSETEACARQAIESAFRHGTHRFDFMHKRIDTGEEFPVDIMLTAIQFNGKPILQAVLRDMTERIQFERKLQAANDELTQHNQEQDQFLSMLSHELKTPLAVIRMSLGQGSEVIDQASRARLVRAVADINAIIERCLQTDRLQHGRIELDKRPFNPGELLRQIIGSSAQAQRVELHAPQLPDGVSDTQLLSVILSNLIDNALKYSAPQAMISVTAIAASRNEQAGVHIKISNLPGSAGLPDAAQVFRKYYRSPGAHSKTGSGLGLHIAQGFSTMLGGELRYTPSDGAVKFVLWIPL